MQDSKGLQADCPLRVLALESSCDESAAAVLDEQQGLLAHQLFSQVDLHRVYGGVVPELASRDHTRRLLPLVQAALEQSGTPLARLDAIAYTAGPGLVGALLTGAALGHGLAFALGVPAVPVHHLEGHLLAPLLEDQAPPFPHLALLVSGGHTLLMQVLEPGRYALLGETRDDAAGEAFDKSAKLLGLPYPGGPELSRLARHGRADGFDFPRPMLDRPGFEFSFSGLKTAVMLAARAAPLTDERRADIAASVQEAIVDTLVGKALRAMDETGLADLVVAGGVGANPRLRERLAGRVGARGGRLYFPRLEFCTDNAAMIAVAGLMRLKRGDVAPGLGVQTRARWPLPELN